MLFTCCQWASGSFRQCTCVAGKKPYNSERKRNSLKLSAFKYPDFAGKQGVGKMTPYRSYGGISRQLNLRGIWSNPPMWKRMCKKNVCIQTLRLLQVPTALLCIYLVFKKWHIACYKPSLWQVIITQNEPKPDCRLVNLWYDLHFACSLCIFSVASSYGPSNVSFSGEK